MMWLNDAALDCIVWKTIDDQQSVYIKNRTEFANKCYNGSFVNFQRQLSEYGFKKIILFRGRTESFNRVIYQRDGFVQGADVARLRKEIVNEKNNFKRKRPFTEIADTKKVELYQDSDTHDEEVWGHFLDFK